MFNLLILTGFLSRERAAGFLSYNQCMKRIECEKGHSEECAEECRKGKSSFINDLLIYVSNAYLKEKLKMKWKKMMIVILNHNYECNNCLYWYLNQIAFVLYLDSSDSMTKYFVLYFE